MLWLYALDYHHWLVLGLLLLALDVFVGGRLLMWSGFVAVVVGVLVLLLPLVGVYPGWDMQILMFFIAATIGIYLWRRDLRSQAARDASAVPLGSVTVLASAIYRGRGTIRINGAAFPVVGPDLPAGTAVRIVALDAMAFRVEPADNPQP